MRMLKFVRVFVHFQHKYELKSHLSELEASKFPDGPFFMTMAERAGSEVFKDYILPSQSFCVLCRKKGNKDSEPELNLLSKQRINSW